MESTHRCRVARLARGLAFARQCRPGARRLATLLLAAALGSATGTALALPPDDPFTVAVQAYLIEINGQPRWQRAADQPLPPASLTKLMTALLVLEDGRPERLVTVSTAAARQNGTRIGLRAGERYTTRDLLAAMLVASANDACQALADAGAEPALSAAAPHGFVQRMNRRAEALGLTATRFRNPCGFDAVGQVSTARELAVIARAALRFPEFARIVALSSVEVQAANSQRALKARSTNPLLGNYAPAVGIKTGYTVKAGPCVVALARQGGAEVLLVMLNARNRWWDAVGLFEQAFSAARGEGR